MCSAPRAPVAALRSQATDLGCLCFSQHQQGTSSLQDPSYHKTAEPAGGPAWTSTTPAVPPGTPVLYQEAQGAQVRYELGLDFPVSDVGHRDSKKYLLVTSLAGPVMTFLSL